jgi:hypothetical protein
VRFEAIYTSETSVDFTRHGFISQKVELFMLIAVRVSEPVFLFYFSLSMSEIFCSTYLVAEFTTTQRKVNVILGKREPNI